MTASDIIERLKLEPHPEGGWFRETWRAETKDGARERHSDLLSPESRRTLSLAPRRRRRNLALLRRRAAEAVDFRGRSFAERVDPRPRSFQSRSAATDCAAACLAGSGKSWVLHACGLHRLAGF